MRGRQKGQTKRMSIIKDPVIAPYEIQVEEDQYVLIDTEKDKPLGYYSNLLKEILKANRTYHSGEIRINKKGLLDAHLHHGDDLYTGYYLVRRQENN